jgi:class 3 adenylate cyclase
MLSLRLVISAWMAVSLVLIASVTLAITLTSSLKALHDIGSAHSMALLDQATADTADLFGAAADQTDLLRNISRSQVWQYPSDDTRTADQWAALTRAAYISGQGAFNSMRTSFSDGTIFSWTESSDVTYQLATTLPLPVATRGTGNSTNSTVNVFEKGTQLLINSTATKKVATSANTTQTTFNRTYPPGSDLYTYNAAPTVKLSGTKIVMTYSTTSILPRHSSQANATSFAVLTTGLQIEKIGGYLANSRQTANMALFAIRGDGFILGSALPGDDGTGSAPYTRSAANGTRPAGCVNLTVTGVNVTTQREYICLINRQASSYTPLRELPTYLWNTSGALVELRQIDDERYFVAVARVPMAMPGLTIQLVLVMPEKDVIGDVVKGQNVAVGVSAAIVVFMAVASFVFVVSMLRPLDDVAERMCGAATFEPETEPMSMSAMQEVKNLQSAYKQMSSELNRIRSFVPQSVLQAGRADAEFSDGDGNAEDSIDFNPDQSAYNVQNMNASHESVLGASNELSDGKSNTSQSKQSKSSKNSQNSKVSKVSASTRLSGSAVVAALDCSVRPQPVSVLAVNCNGFYASTQNMSRDEVVASIATMVDRVVGEVRGRNGVLAFFHGDHFTATFNAVRPCPTHARNAAAAAMSLTAPNAGVSGSRKELTMRAGVSTGKCLVGNVGSAEAKNFSVMGPAFTQALVLERLTRQYTAGDGTTVAALASRRTCEDIGTHYLYEYVDLVQLPGSAQPTLVGRLVGAKANGATNQHDTEWLYVVGNGKTNDPFAASNAAMTELVAGKLVGVAQFLDAVRSGVEGSAKSVTAPSAMRALEASAVAGRQVVTQLGAYYSGSLLATSVKDQSVM